MHALSIGDAVYMLNLMYSQGYEFGLATEFLLCTGLRLGEIAVLEQSAIKGNFVLVSHACDTGVRVNGAHQLMLPKWSSCGRVPIPALLREKLQLFFEHNRKLGQHTWAFPFVNKMPKAFSRRLSKWSRKKGLPVVTAHTLKRTALTWLVAEVLARRLFRNC